MNNLKDWKTELEKISAELIKENFSPEILQNKLTFALNILEAFETEMGKSVIYDDDYQEYLSYAHFHYIIYEGIANDNNHLEYFVIEKTMDKYIEQTTNITKIKESKLYQFLLDEIPKAKELKLEVNDFVKKTNTDSLQDQQHFQQDKLLDNELVKRPHKPQQD